MLTSVLFLCSACETEESETPAEPAPRAAEPGQRNDLFLYDIQYPEMAYTSEAADNRIARLAAALASRAVTLTHEPRRGWLDSLLAALEIDPASQVLVFSRTSLQVEGILPETPRAIYFNDDTYVAYVQGAAALEIASFDSRLGPVFYTLSQSEGPQAEFERRLGACLRCHDSYSMTGGGVPRFIVGSGYIGREGQLVAHEGWILTSDQTQLRFRWGGWYVTGSHGQQVHLGNIVVEDIADLQDLESLRVGNLQSLDGLVDTSPYPSPHSDIVALLILGHQTRVQNLITRVNYDLRTGASPPTQSVDGEQPGADGPADRLATITEPLVQALLFVDAADIEEEITGTSGFADYFELLGPRDSQGRSLRQLNLSSRLFENRLSYMIYSDAFGGLTDEAKSYVYDRLIQILENEDQGAEFERLAEDERLAILEILEETHADFAARRAARRR